MAFFQQLQAVEDEIRSDIAKGSNRPTQTMAELRSSTATKGGRKTRRGGGLDREIHHFHDMFLSGCFLGLVSIKLGKRRRATAETTPHVTATLSSKMGDEEQACEGFSRRIPGRLSRWQSVLSATGAFDLRFFSG